MTDFGSSQAGVAGVGEQAGQGPDWNQTQQGGAVNVFLLPVLRNLCHTHSIILAGAASPSCLWSGLSRATSNHYGGPLPRPHPKASSRLHPIMFQGCQGCSVSG